MVETYKTCIEAIIPSVRFIEPMRYEMSTKLIEGYVQIILLSEKDTKCPRWGTYEEKMRIVHSERYNKESKKKVEKEIDSIHKELGMTRKEFDEIKGIALEMKASGQTEVLAATPIVVAGPLEGVKIAKPCAQNPMMPYVVVVQVKPMRERYNHPTR